MGIFTTTNETKTLDRLTGQLDHLVRTTRAEIARQSEAEGALSAAENALSSALADGAIRADDTGVKAARGQVTTRRAEAEEQRARLKAVRTQLWRLGTTCAREAMALNTEPLDQEADAATKMFRTEWEQAITAFGMALARRQEIERSLTYKLNLPEPEPSGAADASDLLPVHRKFDLFRACLGAVSQIPGPTEGINSEEAALHRDFIIAHRRHEVAEFARFEKDRRESRELQR